MTEKLIIDVEHWLHGPKDVDRSLDKESMLYRPCDGKMCCLGQYLCTRGFDIDAIEKIFTPEEVLANLGVLGWLVTEDGENSCHANVLMSINDAAWYNPDVESYDMDDWECLFITQEEYRSNTEDEQKDFIKLPEKLRKDFVSRVFAANDVEVTFS